MRIMYCSFLILLCRPFLHVFRCWCCCCWGPSTFFFSKRPSFYMSSRVCGCFSFKTWSRRRMLINFWEQKLQFQTLLLCLLPLLARQKCNLYAISHKFCVYASSSSLHSLLCAKIERVQITISNPSSCSQTKNPLHGVINEHKILMLFIINKEFGQFIQKPGGDNYTDKQNSRKYNHSKPVSLIPILPRKQSWFCDD